MWVDHRFIQANNQIIRVKSKKCVERLNKSYCPVNETKQKVIKVVTDSEYIFKVTLPNLSVRVYIWWYMCFQRTKL